MTAAAATAALVLETDLTALVWGARIMLVVVSLGLGLVLVGVPVLFSRPVLTELLRARALGDPWAPFAPDGAGRYGPLAQNRHWAVMRAPARRTSAGLAWRWGWWVVSAVVLVGGGLVGLVSFMRLVVAFWI